jgi:hypothetical protein
MKSRFSEGAKRAAKCSSNETKKVYPAIFSSSMACFKKMDSSQGSFYVDGWENFAP